ncbi:MAG: phosphotransferase [Myxococcota bacterium]
MSSNDVSQLAAPAIPERLDELTPAWLTAALQSTGRLKGEVTVVRTETLGEGGGFVGLIARLHLEFDVDEPGVPSTLIAKLPTGNHVNRALGEMLGSYEREIRFYEELAGETRFAVPRCYFHAMEENPLAGREEEVFRFVNAIPMWLLRVLLPVFVWFGRRIRRRYVLLLEDLSDARVGDQVAGCDAQVAERLARALAANQAELWNSPMFEGRLWLADFAPLARVTQLMFRRNRKEFFRLDGSRLDDSVRPIADWLDRNGVAMMQHLGSRPHAFIHGDFRLDNMFFRDGDQANWLIVIDWQAVGFGRGVFDLSYFLTGNIPVQTLVACEESLVRAYHSGLVEGGVSDYPFATCWRDHQLSKLMLLHRLISSGGLIDLSHERGQKILDRMFEGMLATLPTEDLDSLLTASS